MTTVSNARSSGRMPPITSRKKPSHDSVAAAQESQQLTLAHEAEIKQRNAWIILAAGGGFLVLAIAVVLWMAYRNKQRHNAQLEAKVEERTRALLLRNEKLSEFAHMNAHILRGPLVRVMGMVKLVEESETEEERQHLPGVAAQMCR